MKAATERKMLRWVHLLLSIPILGAVYGQIPAGEGLNAVRYVFLPVVVLTGLWMWKGYWIKGWVKKRRRKKNYL